MTPDEARVGARVTGYARINPDDRGTIVSTPHRFHEAFPPDMYAFVYWDGDSPNDALVYLLSELRLLPDGDQP
jgi:hypothetical protein